MRSKRLVLLVAVFCLALIPNELLAQFVNRGRFGDSSGVDWELHISAGIEAYQQGDYGKAEEEWQAALREAEEFDPEDPRFATSLNNLAELYRAQGKYAEAEPLYKKSLAVYEKA